MASRLIQKQYHKCKISSFDETLSELQGLLDNMQDNCKVVMVGDYNERIGHEGGPRGWDISINSGKSINQFAQINSMTITDLQSHVAGRVYTCTCISHWRASSYIDQIPVSGGIVDNIKQCRVNEEDYGTIHTTYQLNYTYV